MRTDELVQQLPDCYRKDKDSNNYKLLKLAHASIQGFEDDTQQLYDMLDISKAKGKTLDLYGEAYKQKRGALTDEQFRLVVLQKVAQNFVTSDYDSIVKALSVAFGVDINSFVIEETGKPLEVEVKNLPYDVLQATGIGANAIHQIIKAMITVGITLAPLELTGTFEFSDRADEYNELAGFGNIEQSIGGYFGLIAEDNTKIPK